MDAILTALEENGLEFQKEESNQVGIMFLFLPD